MNALLTHPFTEALATGLVHSLWLFAVLIGLGWLAARGLQDARRRYSVYLITLVSLPFAFATVTSLAWLDVTNAWKDATVLGERLGAGLTLTLTDNLDLPGLHLQPGWPAYLATAYLFALLISFVISGYRYLLTLRVRRGGLLPPPDYRRLFARLSEEILARQRVQWKWTERTTEVLTVGILRPVILFPVGLINGLSAAEVEAILRHELTHIYRNDPLWNAVQELVVSLFFYHPLVHWLTHRLNTEREYACDDVVTRSTERAVYAGALLRVAKYSLQPKSPFAMAAIDQNSFTIRIQRMFSQSEAPSRSSATKRRSFLLAALAIVPLCLILAYGTGDAVRPDWITPQGFTPATATASSKIILGTVTDGETGKPLVGASIIIKETTMGTISDFDGNYKITVPDGELTLTYNYVGYTPVVTTTLNDSDNRVDVIMFKSKAGSIEVKPSTSAKEGDTGVVLRTTGEDDSLDAMEGELLIIVDGERYTKGTVKDFSPDSIERIDVIKGEEKLRELGYGTDFKGAILITLKK